MTYDNITMNRLRSEELFYLFKRAEKKKAELKNDPEVCKEKTNIEIEALVASEYYSFGQRMCRRAMIRNFHLVKWFKATIQDEFAKYYFLPIAGFFGTRYQST